MLRFVESGLCRLFWLRILAVGREPSLIIDLFSRGIALGCAVVLEASPGAELWQHLRAMELKVEGYIQRRTSACKLGSASCAARVVVGPRALLSALPPRCGAGRTCGRMAL